VRDLREQGVTRLLAFALTQARALRQQEQIGDAQGQTPLRAIPVAILAMSKPGQCWIAGPTRIAPLGFRDAQIDDGLTQLRVVEQGQGAGRGEIR